MEDLDMSLVALVVGRSLVSAGFSFVTLASPALLFEINEHNTTKADAMRANVEITSTLLAFLARPIIGSAVDSLGRKPGLILGPLVSAVARTGVALYPCNASYVVYRAVNLVSMIPIIQSFSAYLADRFGRGSKKYTRFTKWAFVLFAFVRMVALRFALRIQDNRTNFYVASGLNVAAALIFMLFVKESLKEENRRPIQFKHAANPFGFLKFFRQNKQVTALAVFTVLKSIPEYNGTDVYYQRLKFQWDWKDMARMQQISNMVEIFSPLWSIQIMDRIGRKWTGILSHTVKGLCNLNLALTPHSESVILNPIVGSLFDDASLDILQHDAAESVHAGHGELCSAIMNIRFPLGLLLPRFFSYLFRVSLDWKAERVQGSAPFLLSSALYFINAAFIIPYAWDEIVAGPRRRAEKLKSN